MHDLAKTFAVLGPALAASAGDEIVVLLSGEAVFLLDRGSCEEAVRLAEPGRYVIVPKGTWHTARIATSAAMLFITPGEGTENEVRP